MPFKTSYISLKCYIPSKFIHVLLSEIIKIISTQEVSLLFTIYSYLSWQPEQQTTNVRISRSEPVSMNGVIKDFKGLRTTFEEALTFGYINIYFSY